VLQVCHCRLRVHICTAQRRPSTAFQHGVQPHRFVRTAPDVISPLCCLMRRRGLTVNLRARKAQMQGSLRPPSRPGQTQERTLCTFCRSRPASWTAAGNSHRNRACRALSLADQQRLSLHFPTRTSYKPVSCLRASLSLSEQIDDPTQRSRASMTCPRPAGAC